MPRFYFPLLVLRPSDDLVEIVERDPYSLARRKWQTSTFDLATLATHHRLHLPYQVMDVLLSVANLELAITAASLELAFKSLSALKLGLYVSGISPFIAPFATSYSVNAYSGINSRDSEALRANLPAGMQSGLTTAAGTVEAWPFENSFQCIVIPEQTTISPWVFQQAVSRASRWLEIESRLAHLSALRTAAESAPLLLSPDQSLLHVWCALEALFPRITTEVSFRLSLFLAQLIAPTGDRLALFRRVRSAYDLRSRLAHGSRRDISLAEWQDAWSLLLQAADAVIVRAGLPTEDQLMTELFPSSPATA